jgi:hypothetical protein
MSFCPQLFLRAFWMRFYRGASDGGTFFGDSVFLRLSTLFNAKSAIAWKI